MSELFPPNMDDSNAESAPTLDELTTSTQWPEFCVAVADWEAGAAIYERDEPDERLEMLRRQVIDLGELIGYEYHGKPCHVLGLAYDDRAEGADSAEPTVLRTTRGTFMGCDLQYLNGGWRVLLEVEVELDTPELVAPADGGRAFDVPVKSYYLQPDRHNLMSLHITPEDDNDDDTGDILLSRETVAYLHAIAQDASVRIAQPDFATMSAADQRALLDDCLAELDAGFPRQLRGCEVVVDCAGAYLGYVDMPGMNFKQYVDWNAETLQGQGESVRKGEVISFSYIELEDIPAGQTLSAASFAHGGVPYINLRSDNSDIMYHVPLTAVRDFM